jgi:hypothetical protein
MHKDLVDHLMLDTWPRASIVCDFGITTTEIYAAYQRAVRSGEVVAEDLLRLLGDGPALTKLLNNCKCNQGADRRVKVETPYDQ